MRGIHGIYRFDCLSVEPRILSSLGDCTRQRGPGDEGSHVDASYGIGVRRLAIIDVAAAQWPLANADGSMWQVCNGEIYNFHELRSELQGKGYHFNTGSHAEVLLQLGAAEGDDFVLRLNGMFALALWDVRRRRLLIARDRLDVKPLYVLQDWQRLAFASDCFPERRRRRFLLSGRRASRSDHTPLHRAHGSLPDPGVHEAFLRADVVGVGSPQAAAQVADRRHRFFAGDASAHRVAGCGGQRLGGRPALVHSSVGVDRGVDSESVKHFLVADKPKEYSVGILRIRDDASERRRLALAGRQWMLGQDAWPHVMARLDGVVDRCRTNFREGKGKIA